MRTFGILGLLCLAFGLLFPPALAPAQCPNGRCSVPSTAPVATPQATISPDGQTLTYADGTVYVKGEDGVYRKRDKPQIIGGKKPGCNCYPCECNK